MNAGEVYGIITLFIVNNFLWLVWTGVNLV